MFLFPLFRLYERFGLIMWGRACPLCPVISLLKGGSDLKNHCTFMTFLHEDMYLFKDQILSQFVFCSSNQCKNISVLVFQFVYLYVQEHCWRYCTRYLWILMTVLQFCGQKQTLQCVQCARCSASLYSAAVIAAPVLLIWPSSFSSAASLNKGQSPERNYTPVFDTCNHILSRGV